MVSCSLIYDLTENNVRTLFDWYKGRLPFFDFFTIRKRKNNRILARFTNDVLFFPSYKLEVIKFSIWIFFSYI